MKTAKTFKIQSLFEGENYITVFDANTCNPIEILYNGQAAKERTPTSYDIFSFKEGRGMQLLDNKPTQRSAGECKKTWFSRLRHGGYRIIISPRFDEPLTAENDNGNQKNENENQLQLF